MERPEHSAALLEPSAFRNLIVWEDRNYLPRPKNMNNRMPDVRGIH